MVDPTCFGVLKDDQVISILYYALEEDRNTRDIIEPMEIVITDCNYHFQEWNDSLG